MLTLIPSYGRDFTSAKAVKLAWSEGKDFTICCMMSRDDGRQINKADFDLDQNLRGVMIRYKQLTQICVIKKK